MKVLKFKLSGQTAFFKKPDVNSNVYFTYNSIHKVALTGMFGAILGYGGFNKFKYDMKNIKGFNEEYPEFYTKLKDIKIAIEPLNKNGVPTKKIQTFNNSVGYASQELGGNLIIREQWLENPKWNIYLLLDSEESKKISEYIQSYRSIYQTYLGKNDHYANISEIEIYDIVESKEIDIIHTLCKKYNIEFDMEDEESEEELFKYSERLPVSLNSTTNLYEYETFVYSNMMIESVDENQAVYTVNNKNIVFI